MRRRFLDILDRDQAAQFKRFIDDHDALEAVLVHQALRFGQFGAILDVDKLFARRHFCAHFCIEVFFEAQIAIRDDTEQLLAFNDRKAADAMQFRQGDDVADTHGRRYRDRVAHDAGFETLDLGDFAGLLFRGEVLVNDANATLLRHGDSESGFRDGIHGCRQQRDIQGDIA